MSSETSKPKRRIRYKGTHPRRFHEKYKELNPERYAEDVEKIKSKGNTPVGTHRSICLNEVIEYLSPQPGEVALDLTLGYGGHSSALMDKIFPGGKLIAIERDPIELGKTESRLRAKGIPAEALVFAQSNFKEVKSVLAKNSVSGVDMVLADLGVSSMQLDDPTRGFSYKVEAPLDLRMNPQEGEPAYVLLERIKKPELIEILVENADEILAEPLAAALVMHRPRTTTQVAKAISEVMRSMSPRIQKEQGDAPIRRCFQALRIHVNGELKSLAQLLQVLPDILNEGGRAVFLSFHSGEDRLIKKSFQAGERTGVFSKVASTPVRPSFEEQHANPRSRSAKLRWAVK